MILFFWKVGMLVSKGSGARFHLTCVKHRPQWCSQVMIKTAAGGPLPAVRVYFILHLDKACTTEWLASLLIHHVTPYELSYSLKVRWDGICWLIMWNSLPANTLSLETLLFRWKYPQNKKTWTSFIFQETFHSEWFHHHYFLIDYLIWCWCATTECAMTLPSLKSITGLKWHFKTIGWKY